ncbi:MAG TPA: hypothetical protein VHG28_06645 [Longimicrobiaceae bacterium]|nr:hypothetical protein [Longimicrobiaceae bacterium]
MRRNTLRSRSLLFTLALGVGMLGGFGTAVESQAMDAHRELGPGIHPVVVLAGGSGNTADVQLHLRRVQVESGIASYQGEFTYNVRSLTLRSAELPRGIAGAWNETAPGKIRFAGAALEGVGDRPVLVLHFDTRGAIGAADFGVKIEEVVGSSDFRSLSSRLVVRDQPLFSRTPLK